MATLTRTNSRVNSPIYKDYVNFLASYKNGKKEEDSDSGISVRNFPLSNSSTSTSSSSLSSDVPDFSKNSCTSYNAFLESSKGKRFSSVKPAFEEKGQQNFEEKIQQQSSEGEKKEKTSMKSEIYIEIQPAKSVSEVSKMFEKQERKSPPKSTNQINSRISIFEKQISTENKPKLANKPVLSRPPPPKIDIYKDASQTLQPPHSQSPPPKSQSPPPKSQSPPPKSESPPPKVDIHEASPHQVEVPKVSNVTSAPPPPPMPTAATTGSPPAQSVKSGPPPPPPSQPARLQATLVKGPQTKFQVANPNGSAPTEIDRNDPLVKKLVYGTLRGMYGAYHDKATDMLATLPKNMVVRSNGVQDRIEQIAANGDLDKLNGRVNPKLDQE